MKKFLGLVCAGVVAAMMSGCGLTNPIGAPTITISAIGSINAGTFKDVQGTIKADQAITSVSYSVTDANGGAVSTITVTGPSASNTNSMSFDNTAANELRITVSANATAGSYKLKISATASATADASFDFTVGGNTGTGVTTNAVTIGSYGNSQYGSSVDLDANPPDVMLATDATASGSGVDIVGTYSSSMSAFRVFNPVYAANSSGINAFANWQNPAATQICKETGTAFASITTKQQIQSLFNAASASDNVSCQQGDVLIVKTDQNAYAAVEITSFDASTSGTAVLTVKY
ncbi:MAG TPA: hypothetical protein VLX68_13345 [Chitinivibrionales bacterium]|nr:hypothetical protein [Chitinivibrionales bacterium]